MDRHCSRQSPYRPSAGQVYLDYLRLDGQDDCIDERCRAHDLSVRPLSLSELEEHYKRYACLQKFANDRWAKIEHIRGVEKRAFTALHQCKFTPAKANHGKDDTHRQLSGRILQQPHARPRPRPLDLPNEGHMEQQSLGARREQRGYSEFEIADQKRRVARMGLGGQQCHGKGATPHTTHPIPLPVPTNRRFPRTSNPKEESAQQMQEQSKAQEQQSETPACGPWVQERTNEVLLKNRTRQEAGQRKLAQQKHEQQKVQLPPAKPGNLYPGTSRISGILPPIRIAHDNMEQNIMSELALSVHLKSKMASQEAYRKYKEEKEQRKEEKQRKAALSAPGSEATRTESVKQFLASVNKALEQEVEAAEVEAAETKGVEKESLRTQSQQRHKCPEDAYEACLKYGESLCYKYGKGYPIPRQFDGINCSPSVDFASVQALTASLDHSIGADKSARHTGISQMEASLYSSRTSSLRAAVEAIDKTTGDLLESPKTASGQDEPPLLEPAAASILRKGYKCVVNVASLSLVTHKDLSVEVPRQDVSLLPIPQPEQTDRGSELRENEESVEDAAKTALLRDVDIPLDWEEVDDSLGGDGWIVVEQDFVDNVLTGSSSSSDVEWASDVASEGSFDS
ncbi:MAG: hypothetical protein Q9175_001897 [Cornicularia normoerica]